MMPNDSNLKSSEAICEALNRLAAANPIQMAVLIRAKDRIESLENQLRQGDDTIWLLRRYVQRRLPKMKKRMGAHFTELLRKATVR